MSEPFEYPEPITDPPIEQIEPTPSEAEGEETFAGELPGEVDRENDWQGWGTPVFEPPTEER